MGAVTARGQPFQEEQAAMAFDGIKSTKWLDDYCCPTTWIEITFPAPVTVLEYTVSSANDFPGRDPKDWQLLGDGGVVDTRSGVGFTARFQPKTFSIGTPAAYTTYRLSVLAANDGGNVHQFSELSFKCTGAAKGRGGCEVMRKACGVSGRMLGCSTFREGLVWSRPLADGSDPWVLLLHDFRGSFPASDRAAADSRAGTETRRR